jgi:hypothetical protein
MRRPKSSVFNVISRVSPDWPFLVRAGLILSVLLGLCPGWVQAQVRVMDDTSRTVVLEQPHSGL